MPERQRRAETIIQGAKQHKVSQKRLCSCGAKKSYGAKRCIKCYKATRYKVNWPSVNDLVEMLNNSSYAAIGKKLGVSDNAVRKHLQKSMG